MKGNHRNFLIKDKSKMTKTICKDRDPQAIGVNKHNLAKVKV